MTWVAISGGGVNWVCPEMFQSPEVRRDHLLARGSLLIETRLSPEGRPQTLLSYQRRYPWAGGISLQAIPGGGLVLVLSQADDVFHTVLDYKRDARTDVLRITFSWDGPQRWGRLVVERPEADTVDEILTPAPLPLMLEDVYTMTRRPQLCETDRDVVFFAVSDAVEPIGPMPSLTGGVPVATPRGYRALRDLRFGDTVFSRDDAVVPVLHTVARTVPALGSFRPVRLRAPYFGLARDVVVAPHQRLVIGGSEVEYIFGREAVLVPAISLVNGFAAVFEEGHRLVRYAHLLLPGNEAMIVAGAAMESLYAGRLGRNRERLAATLLADCPRHLMPAHHRAGYQVLRPFEAITLAEARVA
ncbi:Hint domain-containing protein [Puniceibacterium confluentis]|uniref:Hint domain-containing protein n=1 Tax=Puniceibacterium confluentis TaxID=1958944 RepID=UPI0011B43F3A|nr:Hint domain-containing protein [Puniceibacterium confluentis]